MDLDMEFVNTIDPAAADIHVRTMCSNLFWQKNQFVCTSVVNDVLCTGLEDRKNCQL